MRCTINRDGDQVVSRTAYYILAINKEGRCINGFVPQPPLAEPEIYLKKFLQIGWSENLADKVQLTLPTPRKRKNLDANILPDIVLDNKIHISNLFLNHFSNFKFIFYQ